jgi:hypothetical protein
LALLITGLERLLVVPERRGQSHLYLSFDSETVHGIYNKKTLPELNNHIDLIPF